jgi:magnesium transporter
LVLERFGEKIDGIEETFVDQPRRELLHEIHALKREMIDLRKSVWPLREVVSGLERMETRLIKKSRGPFLRDVYDHAIRSLTRSSPFARS